MTKHMTDNYEAPSRPLKAVKEYCLYQCCAYEPGYSPEGKQLWRECENTGCELWPLRLGRYPKGQKLVALRSIKAFCKTDCCNWHEAGDTENYQAWQECNIGNCPLHAFRLGTNPHRIKHILPELERQKLVDRLSACRAVRASRSVQKNAAKSE